MPYTLVKDNRTGEETGNVQSVMDGNIDNFINAYLSWIHNYLRLFIKKELNIEKSDAGQRLDKFLLRYFNKVPSHLYIKCSEKSVLNLTEQSKGNEVNIIRR